MTEKESKVVELVTTPKPQRIVEQDLNTFELVDPNDRQDTTFKGKWVGIAYKMVKIQHVDDATYTFDADFFLYMTWDDPKLVGVEKGKKYAKDDLPWEPKLSFKNDINFDIVSESFWVQNSEKGTVDSSMRIRGTFFEHLELENFPCDRQNLRLFVNTFYHKDNCRFYQRDDRPNSFAANRFPMSEWEFEEDSVELRWNKVASGNTYYNYIINCPLRRRHEFYTQNTIITNAMLLTMGAGSFWFDISSIDNRLNYIVTLALTAVAFKFLMTDRLPRVPYSTLLDKYLYLIFLQLTLLTIALVIIGVVPDMNLKVQLNLIFFLIYIGTGFVEVVGAMIVVGFREKILKDTDDR